MENLLEVFEYRNIKMCLLEGSVFSSGLSALFWDLKKFLPGEDVSAEDTANDVAQVGDIVDVRQGTGHQDVSFALLWQTEEKKQNLDQVQREDLSWCDPCRIL